MQINSIILTLCVLTSMRATQYVDELMAPWFRFHWGEEEDTGEE